MVDAADLDKLEGSRNELHNLIDKPQLLGIPVLVLGNKRDLVDSLDEKDLIDRMYVLLRSFAKIAIVYSCFSTSIAAFNF